MHLLLLLAQVAAPPEFQSTGTFQPSAATATVDGTSHTAAEQARINLEIVSRLRQHGGHEDGLRLIDSKLYAAAEALFRKRNQPAGVAVALYLNGKVEASEAVLSAAPRELQYVAFWGEMHASAKSAEAIRTIAAANPASGEAQYYLALAMTPGSDAEKLLARAAELDRSDTKALLALARRYTERDEKQKAIGALEAALQRNANQATAHYRLAGLYRETGDMEKSRAHMAAFQKLRQ